MLRSFKGNPVGKTARLLLFTVIALELFFGVGTRDAWANSTAEAHTHNNITFTQWTSTPSQPMPSEAGRWYLTDNVTLSETWVVPSGTTILCLNGKTIALGKEGTASVIEVPAGSTLWLYDENDEGTITHDPQQTNALGSGVYVRGGGTFVMCGGTISGNDAGEDSGGGVLTWGTFSMRGGVIRDNKSCSGGGVAVFMNFDMSGGSITGNEAKFDSTGVLGGFGGGVCLMLGGVKLTGGTITQNTAAKVGGGVYAEYPNTLVNLLGTPVIADNAANGAASNLCLGKLQGHPIITIYGALKDGARIGVSTASSETFTTGYKTKGNSADPSTYFFSDDPNCDVLWTAGEDGGKGNEARLVRRHSISVSDAVTGGEAQVDKSVAHEGDTVTVTVLPNEGYELKPGVVTIRNADEDHDVIATINTTDNKAVFTMPNKDVDVEATFSAINYTVSVSQDIKNGTVSVDKEQVHVGDAVKITAKANSGYEVDVVTAKDEKGNTIKTKDGSFTMPASNVTISATFAKRADPDPTTTPTPVPTPTPAPTLAKATAPKTEVHPSKGTMSVVWKTIQRAEAYQLQWRKVGGTWQSKTVKSRKATIRGLKKGALYQIRVRGVAGATEGAWSKVVRRWARQASGVKTEKSTRKGFIRVSWKKDAKATAGFKVLIFAKKNGKAIKTVKVAKGKSSAVIKGLKSGTTYYIRIRPSRTKRGTVYSGAISGYKAVRI